MCANEKEDVNSSFQTCLRWICWKMCLESCWIKTDIRSCTCANVLYTDCFFICACSSSSEKLMHDDDSKFGKALWCRHTVWYCCSFDCGIAGLILNSSSLLVLRLRPGSAQSTERTLPMWILFFANYFGIWFRLLAVWIGTPLAWNFCPIRSSKNTFLRFFLFILAHATGVTTPVNDTVPTQSRTEPACWKSRHKHPIFLSDASWVVSFRPVYWHIALF